MKGQKEAVVEAVINELGSAFVSGQTIALSVLSQSQCERIKRKIGDDIYSGAIQYSKDASNIAEVYAYARSMVMNHLKKAKELNGGSTYKPVATRSTSAVATASSTNEVDRLSRGVTKNLNLSIMPEDLATFIKEL